MEHGRLIEMGQITTIDQDGLRTEYKMALVIEFASADEIRQALKERTCTFGFGDDEMRKTEPNGAQMTDEQKALAYYKAALEQRAPPWVPWRVRLTREMFGDPPWRGAGVAAGEHLCYCNNWGAVSVLDRADKPLGLRPSEFEPIAWRESLAPRLPGA